jgi:hypothetical protein
MDWPRRPMPGTTQAAGHRDKRGDGLAIRSAGLVWIKLLQQPASANAPGRADSTPPAMRPSTKNHTTAPAGAQEPYERRCPRSLDHEKAVRHGGRPRPATRRQ